MEEEWKPWRDGAYEVSREGHVRRARATHGATVGMQLKGYVARDGYRYIKVSGHDGRKNVAIHWMVAEAFLGPRPSDFQINHRDGIKTHNAVDNIEYCTRAENMDHAARTGLSASGERSGARTMPHRIPRGEQRRQAKVTAADVLDIRTRRAKGESTRDLGRAFGIHPTTVRAIVRGDAWGQVPLAQFANERGVARIGSAR